MRFCKKLVWALCCALFLVPAVAVMASTTGQCEKLVQHALAVLDNYAEAVPVCRKAAEQGYAKAEYNLGRLYDMGQGVPQDYAKAVYWYRKAAEQGDVTAETNLGWEYTSGKGVPRDYVTAAKWFFVAKAFGSPEASLSLGLMEDRMTRSQIIMAQQRAEQWWAAHHETTR